MLAVLHSNDQGEAQFVREVSKKEDLCSLCEEFASEALDYLTLNETQEDIITILHKSCSKIPSFKQQVLQEYVEHDCLQVESCNHYVEFDI